MWLIFFLDCFCSSFHTSQHYRVARYVLRTFLGIFYTTHLLSAVNIWNKHNDSGFTQERNCFSNWVMSKASELISVRAPHVPQRRKLICLQIPRIPLILFLCPGIDCSAHYLKVTSLCVFVVTVNHAAMNICAQSLTQIYMFLPTTPGSIYKCRLDKCIHCMFNVMFCWLLTLLHLGFWI